VKCEPALGVDCSAIVKSDSDQENGFPIEGRPISPSLAPMKSKILSTSNTSKFPKARRQVQFSTKQKHKSLDKSYVQMFTTRLVLFRLLLNWHFDDTKADEKFSCECKIEKENHKQAGCLGSRSSRGESIEPQKVYRSTEKRMKDNNNDIRSKKMPGSRTDNSLKTAETSIASQKLEKKRNKTNKVGPRSSNSKERKPKPREIHCATTLVRKFVNKSKIMLSEELKDRLKDDLSNQLIIGLLQFSRFRDTVRDDEMLKQILEDWKNPKDEGNDNKYRGALHFYDKFNKLLELAENSKKKIDERNRRSFIQE
jgi:hypothetical protein